jgi:DUF4097 and DUF4098 domain-containing protein YvlB
MTNMPRLTRTLAFLALCAAVVPLAAQHKGKPKHGRRDEDGTTRIDTTVSVGRNATIDLSLISGEIKVTSWDKPQVQIRASTDEGDLRFEASSSRVTLDIEQDNGDGDTHFEVIVPRDARVLAAGISGDIAVTGVNEVEATSVSGDVVVNGVTKRASLQTVSGEIRAGDLGGPVKVNNVSGDISLSGVAGDLNVQTVSGEMKLHDVKSSYVRTQTVSGDMEFDGTIDPKGSYEFHSHSGSMTITIPRGTGATVSMRGFSGELNSSCPMTMQPNGEATGAHYKNMTFTIGDGGARLNFETFSGDVTLRGCGGSKSKED